MASAAENTTVKENWKDYVLSPAQLVLKPERTAIVPKDPELLPDIDIAWQPATDRIQVPAGEEEALLLDFGKKLAGHFILRSADEKEFTLSCTSGPVLELMKFDAELHYDSHAGVWRDPQFRAFRYIMLSRREGSAIRISAEFEFTGYPGEYKGWFRCSDNQLNRIWYTGIYTVHLCTHPHEESGSYNYRLPREFGEFPANWRSPYGRYVIWDGPRRDREVWIGDMWPECLALMYSFGAPEVMKTSLWAVACRQREDGLIPGSGITQQPFAEYACWWMALLDRFHLLTGDDEFVHDMKEPIRRLMKWLKARLAENNGFLHIDHRQTWAWTLMRRGVVTGSQCVAVAALRGGSRMLALLGDDAEAEILAEEGEALAERIRTQLWNPETMCFNDSLNPPDGVRRFSCDSNAVAVLLKIATPEQADGALAYLREHLWTPYGTRTILPPEPEENWNWAHNHNVWPFVVGLELEARFEHGDFEGAMELSRKCWGNMVDRGSEAFWEVVDLESGGFLTRRPIADIQPGWDAWDSYSHGWSAGISYMLQAFLLGIQPVEPGFAKFCVRPNFCGLEFIEGAVPTPHGTIEAHFEMRGTGRVLVPRGTRAEIMLPDGSSRKLEPGEHQVSWATQ